MCKVLAKYDIRGIQSYVFRTNKLKEIRAVQDLPEKIVFESIIVSSENYFKEKYFNIKLSCANEDDTINNLAKEGIEILDKAGGNAFVIFKDEELYKELSKRMAFYILKKTYSLKLVYTCVKCSDNFYDDYEKLNRKLGQLKSSMPEAAHIGVLPICMQDYSTGFPITAKDDNNKFLSVESELKLGYHKKSNDLKENEIDSYILEKGVDSHIAVIHIDGNNMGNRINNIIKTASYENARNVFSSIKVRSSFAEVCNEMDGVITEYKKNFNDDKYLILALIKAGDDITYITRADIALSFTKLFLKKVSQKYMYEDPHNPKNYEYMISACAGIAFCNSHFPFTDAYELAENLCASAKKRAKEKKSESGVIGNWIDYEICGHIRDVDISQNRKKYASVDDTYLLMKPYFVESEVYKYEEYSFETFESYLKKLLAEKPILNRSRAKALREAYTQGETAVSVFRNTAISRGYLEGKIELYRIVDNKKIAVLYDPIDIMDMYTDLEDYLIQSEKTEDQE